MWVEVVVAGVAEIWQPPERPPPTSRKVWRDCAVTLRQRCRRLVVRCCGTWAAVLIPRMAIENHTSQDVEAVAALAESLADDDGLGEAFRRADPDSIDGVWLHYSQAAQGILSALQEQGWKLKRA